MMFIKIPRFKSVDFFSGGWGWFIQVFGLLFLNDFEKIVILVLKTKCMFNTVTKQKH
jgi:hypothetical protein